MYITIPSSALLTSYLHRNKATKEDLKELRSKHTLLFAADRVFNFTIEITLLLFGISTLLLPVVNLGDLSSGIRHLVSWLLLGSLLLSVILYFVTEKIESIRHREFKRPNVSLKEYQVLKQQFAEIIGEPIFTIDTFDEPLLKEIAVDTLIKLRDEYWNKRHANLDCTQEFEKFGEAHDMFIDLGLVPSGSWLKFFQKEHEYLALSS